MVVVSSYGCSIYFQAYTGGWGYMAAEGLWEDESQGRATNACVVSGKRYEAKLHNESGSGYTCTESIYSAIHSG